ncbi:NusG domain II-containing protein [Paenibacillus brevis]|uniref:NusG domain II-containing protein n=1 Tax=Paenibacillus brevis TaxID=2841508 RepID=A0ABS6FQX3_9BACL|nr:NusG domain II-containing protein [Paenibacillus brevis]MBU5671867.1 NusG domain II-containing protein [Paenibacillus brevis]
MLKLKRGDILLIVLLLTAGVGWLVVQYWDGMREVEAGQLSASISVDGEFYRSVSLDGEDEEIDIQTEYGHNILKKFDGGIQMIYADCPKKISMAMGFISRPNQTIICVPNRVFVEIVGSPSPDIDPAEEIDAYVR